MTSISALAPGKLGRLSLLLLLILSASALIAWAGCKSDCRDEYDSEMESCKLLYDDPEDADDLRMCIQGARDEFDSCIEECEN